MFRRAPFCEARETLLQAARDGRLASAFKEMRKASGLQFGLWVLGVTWCDYDNLIDFSCLQDQLREHNAFWAVLCNVLYGLWLLSGLYLI